MEEKIINFVIAPGSQFNSNLDLQSLLTFLSNNSSFTFKPLVCKSYEEAIVKLNDGDAEMGWLGGHFSSSSNENNIEPFAVGLPEGENSPNYNCLFIVKNNSKIHKLENIKKNKIVVNNLHSTSGYIIPKKELSNLGIDLENESEFSQVLKAENHDEAIQLLLSDEADVAAVSSINFNDFVRRDKKNASKIKIIHKSHPIPGAPLVFSSLLNEEEKQIIKNLVFIAHNHVEIGGYGGRMKKYIPIAESNKKFLEAYIQRQWKWPTFLSLLTFIGLTVLAVIDLEINPVELFQNTFLYLSDVIARMLPPDFSNLGALLLSMLETLEMAFLGTLLAILLSIPFGFLSAKNISPNNFIYFISRTITIFFRAVPEFIMAMLLVIAVGFGAIPGVLALGFHTMGFLAKFYAEAIEHIDPGPGNALSSMNASKLQVIAFAVIPQILPSFVANNLYILDRNIRMATMLGIIGAGGIGYELQSSFRMFDYPRVSSIIILIFITIFIIDFISSYVRKSIIEN